jgi:hypothetical protein
VNLPVSGTYFFKLLSVGRAEFRPAVAQPRVSQRGIVRTQAANLRSSGSDKDFFTDPTAHHAAKMRYIHSEEDLKVPEGGALSPKFHPFRP